MDQLLEFSGKLDRFDATIEQLRKGVPTYLSTFQSISNQHHQLSVLLKTIATLETNQNLQTSMFLFSQKYEILSKYQSNVQLTSKYIDYLLDESRDQMLSPLKELVTDAIKTKKKLPSTSQHVPTKAVDQIIDPASSLQEQQIAYYDQTLPIHEQHFETHRVRNVKRLLSSVLRTELRAHVQAVEELSQALTHLEQSSEDETEEERNLDIKNSISKESSSTSDLPPLKKTHHSSFIPSKHIEPTPSSSHHHHHQQQS